MRVGLRKRVRGLALTAASATPIVRRYLSPLRLRRTTSFQTHCEQARELPKQIGSRGFYLQVHGAMTERRVPPFCLAEEQLAAFWAQVPFYQHGLEHDVQPAFLAGLCNASVLSGGTVVRSSDNFLFYEPFHVPKHVWQSGLSRLLLPPIDLDLRGDYIHLGLLWATAHYHWV